MAEGEAAASRSGTSDGGTHPAHNIRTIREVGCAVPTPAMIDSLDPAEIEFWFADGAFTSHSLDNVIRALANSTEEPDQGS